jgi:hypothetical protein
MKVMGPAVKVPILKYGTYSRWKNGKARLLTVQDSHRGIKISPRPTGTVSGVKRKAPEEGHRTLGFKISGDGKCIAKKKEMKEKAIYLEKRLGVAQCGAAKAAWHTTFYMPSLVYGTPATTLTKQDREEIQKPIVNSILPKMGMRVQLRAPQSFEQRSLEEWV